MKEIMFCDKCGDMTYNDPKYFNKPGQRCLICRKGHYINTGIDSSEAFDIVLKYHLKKYGVHFQDSPQMSREELYREVFYYGKLDGNHSEKLAEVREEKDASWRRKQNAPASVPKCPSCGSTNLSKITATRKILKVGLFGRLGTGDLGKTYQCGDCGVKF